MKLAFVVAVAALATALTVRTTAQDRTAGRDGWNREAAARYLDERMDGWFASATKLRTGDTQTGCVSCHTSIPYALARPRLRQAMQVSALTAQEVKLVEDTTRRVETYDTHQLLYENTQVQKTQSRGTEAVINALILASAGDGQQRREPGGAARKAFAHLWETQRADGSWDWLQFGLEPFESVGAPYYGATLAALAAGTAPGVAADPAATAGIEKLRGFVNEHYAEQSLFNQTWVLLASTRLKDLLPRAQRETLIANLQTRQREDGGWSMDTLGPWRWSKTVAPFAPPGPLDASLLAKSDGYATGLIVYALRQAGFAADQPSVKRGLQWLRANQQDVQIDQQPWNIWRSHSLNYDREHGGERGQSMRRMFMSDAATAFAVLALSSSE